MNKHIAVLAGDGIGPEITDGAVNVLEQVARRFGHTFTFEPLLMGGCAIDACGEPLPAHTVARCLASDSVLLGAVGGPKWDALPGDKRPEKGLLGIMYWEHGCDPSGELLRAIEEALHSPSVRAGRGTKRL